MASFTAAKEPPQGDDAPSRSTSRCCAPCSPSPPPCRPSTTTTASGSRTRSAPSARRCARWGGGGLFGRNDTVADTDSVAPFTTSKEPPQDNDAPVRCVFVRNAARVPRKERRPSPLTSHRQTARCARARVAPRDAPLRTRGPARAADRRARPRARRALLPRREHGARAPERRRGRDRRRRQGRLRSEQQQWRTQRVKGLGLVTTTEEGVTVDRRHAALVTRSSRPCPTSGRPTSGRRGGASWRAAWRARSRVARRTPSTRRASRTRWGGGGCVRNGVARKEWLAPLTTT